jgi:hypothetical protein
MCIYVPTITPVDAGRLCEDCCLLSLLTCSSYFAGMAQFLLPSRESGCTMAGELMMAQLFFRITAIKGVKAFSGFALMQILRIKLFLFCRYLINLGSQVLL